MYYYIDELFGRPPISEWVRLSIDAIPHQEGEYGVCKVPRGKGVPDETRSLIRFPRGASYLSVFPGTCGTVVWHELPHDIQQNDFRFVKRLCLKFGYTQVVATMIEQTQIKAFRHNEWLELQRFVNSRTGNEVVMFGYDLSGYDLSRDQ